MVGDQFVAENNGVRCKLRIHFGSDDLARTYLADMPDPAWESILSVHVMRARRSNSVFGEWRRRAVRDLSRRGIAGRVRTEAFAIIPAHGYFPDFLTPPEGRLGLEPALDAILATPPRRIGTELGHLAKPPDGAYASALSGRGAAPRRRLVRTLRRYHAAAVAPYWPDIATRAQADRALRVQAMREGGIDALLSGLGPAIRWRPPVLEVDYPVERDLWLDGRGLVLIPSYFCWRNPVALADADLPPTLVYPMDHERGWLTARSPATADPADPTARLLGPTRAAILRGTSSGATTGQLADRVGITPAGVSQHTATLRESGLITSHRRDRYTVHVLTRLGEALLRGRTTAA